MTKARDLANIVAIGSGDVEIPGNLSVVGTTTLSADPVSALQAATKSYVDTIAAAGLHYHDPVRVESPVNLNATYNNGTAGVGATLTNAGTQEAITIDGVTLSLNDRVLIYVQTDATQNGIYTVTTVGDGSTNWVLTRATDADSYAPSDPDSLGQGDAFFVLEGATGAGELYVMNTEGTITFGTTNITFTQVAATGIYTAGTNLQIDGTTFSTVASPTFTDITATTSLTSGTGSFSGNLTVDTNTLFVDAANNRVGIGTSSPSQALDVAGNIAVTGTVDGRDIAQNIPASLGTAGQVLTVNTGATAAEWVDASGGGSWEYISTSTASNAASVTITLPAGYIALMVRLGNISCSAVNQLRGRFNASHQMRTNLLAGWYPSVSNDANGTTAGVRLVDIDRGFTYGSPWRTQGQIIINQGYDSSSTFSSIYSQVSVPNQNVLEFNIASGISETAAVDTSFQIYPSTGTFSGTFALYALKNS